MKTNIKSCRIAHIDDMEEIVHLHKLAFPGFFLTTLGSEFLLIMYRTFLFNSGGVFLVDEENNRLQGFAVGVMKSAGKDRRLAIRFLPQFLLAIIPALVRNPINVLKRFATQFFAVGKEPAIPDDAVVLRSIGVLPDAKGRGVAGRLLIEFEEQAKMKGAKIVALTTDARENERAIGFYRKNGYEIAQEFEQDKNRAMLLMLKKLNHRP